MALILLFSASVIRLMLSIRQKATLSQLLANGIRLIIRVGKNGMQMKFSAEWKQTCSRISGVSLLLN